MTRTCDYRKLTDDQRHNALVLALEQLLKAQARYATLNIGEAALAVLRHFPTAELVAFDSEELPDGEYTAELISVRDSTGELLWLVDDPEAEHHPIAEDTGVTDRIAIARIHGAEFNPVREPGRDDRDRVVFKLHVPTALEEAARASK